MRMSQHRQAGNSDVTSFVRHRKALTFVLPPLLLVTFAAAVATDSSYPTQSERSSAQQVQNDTPGCIVTKPMVTCPTIPSGYIPASKTDGPVAITPVASAPSANIPAGSISSEMMGPFSSEQYLIQNAWWNESGEVVYDVYAGAMTSNASQGVVVVFSHPADNSAQVTGGSLIDYPSPGADGSLSIVSSDGWTLTLSAADGTAYVFDVLSGTYQ